MRNLVAVIASLFCLSTTALAEGSSKGYGMGGWYEQFGPVVQQYNQSGELFRITGHCQSLCTLFLSIRNVCVEHSARLLFHAGHDRQRRISATSTERMLSAYNGTLRNYLVANGYMSTLAFHTISGQDIISKFGYRACPGRA
jgi:hypothetical protein